MDVEKLTKDTVERGGTLALLYYDLQGSTKDVVQQSGAAIVQQLLGHEGVVYAVGEIDEPMENAGMLSSSLEVRILVKSFPSLAGICGSTSPFSIELLKPGEIRMPVDQAHDLLMSISVNNYELKKTMLEKVLRGEDLENFRKRAEARLKLGKKILEKK